ncbi:MAG TPA: carboxypeptidase regulatory-like domain-containing protein [Galbitalea sp.]|jgi:hypothetical protein|nr:carboxypeptidase regulatory-like domain-containing protein [Galbitalea sp.]
MSPFFAARKSVSPIRAFASALAALTAAAMLTLGMSAAASATVPATGSFNLTLHTYYDHSVELDNSALVEGAQITLYHFDADEQEWDAIRFGTTGANGQLGLALDGLVVGDEYAVFVDATAAIDVNTSLPVTDSSGWIVPQGSLMESDFDGNASDGPQAVTYFTQTAGLTNWTEYLTPGATLSGNILGPDGGGGYAPTTSADEIDFYRQTINPDGFVDFEKYTSVTPTGSTYSVPNLAPGTYVVGAHQSTNDTWPATTFNLGADTFASAAPFQVRLYTTQTHDVQFVAAGTISGTMTLDPALDPSEGQVAEVLAFPLDAQGNTDQDNNEAFVGQADPTTDAYSISVAPGKYDVEFVPENEATDDAAGHHYYPTWYGDSPFAQGSTPITVAGSGDVHAGIDGTVGKGLTVTGNVSSLSGGPLEGIEVDLVSQDGNPTLSTTTDASGNYTKTVPPDDYNLTFTDPNGNFPSRVYTGTQDGSGSIGLGTTISQITGTFNANFVYDDYSTLTIHLSNKAGTALSGVDIEADALTDGTEVPNLDEVGGVPVSGHPGTYLLSGLQQGQDYSLLFTPPFVNTTGTYQQYYGGGTNETASKLFTATSSAASLDITLASSAAISGVVTTTANKAIKGVGVDLYNFDGTSWNYEKTAVTSSTGAYSFPNLATGSYTVDFDTADTSAYVGEYAGGGVDAAHATHVYVAAGKPAVLSQHLALGGTISGVVAGPGGSPKLSDIEVDPVALSGTLGHFTAASPDNNSYTYSTIGGKFSLTGLPTGYYALSFTDASGDDTYGSPDTDAVNDNSVVVYHVTAGKATVVPGTINLPLLSDQATGNVVGSLDTSLAGTFGEAAGEVDIFDQSGNFVTETSIFTDGTFSASLIPGEYSYSALIFDPNNPQDRFAEEDGALTVSSGANPFVIPVVPAVPLAFTTDPAITDTSDSRVGTTYYVNNVTWNHTNASVSYQWMRDGEPIYGATGTSYTSQSADFNTDLEVRVTLVDDNFQFQPPADVQESVVKYATAANSVTASDAIVNNTPPSTPLDNTTGRVTVGQAVKGSIGNWADVPGVHYEYDWYQDGTSTLLGTGQTFTPTAAEAGSAVRLSVTASELGYNPVTVGDPASLLIVPITAPILKVAPKITSKVVAGNTVYTVTPGTWSITGTTPGYVWNETGVVGPVSTTNSVTYVASGGDPDAAITVTVKASKAGYASGTTTVTARKSDGNVTANGFSLSIQDSVVGAVSGSATPVPVGSTLSMPTGVSWVYPDDSSAATTFTYQWYRAPLTPGSSAAIAGATKSSYVVSSADVGHRILLDVFASSPTHLADEDTFIGGTGGLRQDLVNVPASVHAAAANTNAPLTKITDTVSTWGPTTAVTNNYQWLLCTGSDCSDPTSVDYSVIPKATTSTFVPPIADANDHVALRVTGSKSTFAPYSVYGPVTTIGDGHTISSMVAPSISAGLAAGKATFGVKLTAKAGTWDVPSITPGYIWQISTNGSTWIPANGTNTLTTYTPVLADFQAGATYIRIGELATKAGYTTNGSAASAGAPLVQATPVPTVKPVLTTVNTTATVHGSWTVSPGTWPTAGGVGTVSYTWLVNNSSSFSYNAGNGDTTNTFDRTNVGQQDYVSLTIEHDGGVGYKPAFVNFIMQKGAAPTWNAPTISGTPVYGNTLSAPTAAADAFTFPSPNSSAQLAYQWYSGTTAISKATSSSFTPSSAYVGKTISVKITSNSLDYATASHLTAGVLFAAAPAPRGSPTLSYTGTVHPGGTVGLTFGGYSVTGLTHGYQWRLSTDGSTWTNIAGATKATYLVPAVDLGDHLDAIVTSSKAGYASGGSDPTDDQLIVEPTVLQPTTGPTLAGSGTVVSSPTQTDAVGATITVSAGVWNVVGATFSYEWFRDGIEIPGVTGTTFVPTSEEYGETISVEITAHAAGYDPVTFSPNSLQVTAGAAPTNVTKPKITGSMVAGSTLSASNGIWSLDGLTFSYQWYSGTGTATIIPGATSSTWVVDETLHGQPVFVVVTATRDGYASAGAASTSTGSVI